MATYTYEGTDFKNATNLNIDDITALVNSSAISTAALLSIDLIGAFPDCTLNFNFDGNLSSSDLDILDNIVDTYTYQEPNGVFAVVLDKKTSGTNAGTFENNVWEIRALNHIDDSIEFAELASNQLTLFPGVYIVRIRAPAYGVGAHRVRLYDVTNEAVVEVGSISHSAENELSYAELQVYISISINTTYEVQHICQNEVTDVGLGKAFSLGGSEEIYTAVYINKK